MALWNWSSCLRVKQTPGTEDARARARVWITDGNGLYSPRNIAIIARWSYGNRRRLEKHKHTGALLLRRGGGKIHLFCNMSRHSNQHAKIARYEMDIELASYHNEI
jgi:hypothetical protein